MAEIRLDTPTSCRDELQRCSNGIATLIPEYTKLREEKAAVDESLEVAEALATVAIATDNLRITATELKARVVKTLYDDPMNSGKLSARRHELNARLEVIERRFRSLEKRLSAAQSALNDHRSEERAAGSVEAAKR